MHSDDEDPAEANLRIRLAQAMTRNRKADLPTAADLHAELGGSDEEDFAQQQIRKGLGGVAVAPVSKAPVREARLPGGGRAAAEGAAQAMQALREGVQRLKVWLWHGRCDVRSEMCLPSGIPRPVAMLILHDVQAGHAVTERQQAKSAEAAARSAKTLEALQAQLEAAGSRYQDVQQLRAYIADLCDMLQVC